jgi:hypothetical protein
MTDLEKTQELARCIVVPMFVEYGVCFIRDAQAIHAVKLGVREPFQEFVALNERGTVN